MLLACEGESEIELVLPRQRTDGTVGTVRAVVNVFEPTNHHLQLLADLEIASGQQVAAIARRWGEAFSVERVAKRFYIEFKALRDRLVEVLKDENQDNALLIGGESDSEVSRYVTRNLGRILFLWFLQSKGWLNGDNRYFLNLFEERCRIDPSHNFFASSLLPLFFDAMAVPVDDRSAAAHSLGDIPYLNGGLFLRTHFEEQLCAEGQPPVTLPNTVFDPQEHRSASPTVLGLLRGYRFTTRESTPDDQSVDPDPELLGKVFENLNEEEGRHQSGTYYTPREIVRFMCRETIDGYLQDETGFAPDVFEALREEALDPEATDFHLPAAKRARIDKALASVTVCDPAVGSGAFAVGMLQEILQLRRGLYHSADVLTDPGGQQVSEWKREIVTNSLYGVDINPEAIEITQLRLWLTLVIDADRPEPLPNLDFRFVAGDSLIDRVGSTRFSESLPREGEVKLRLDWTGADDLATIETELEELRRSFAETEGASAAQKLRTRIKELQTSAVRAQIDAAIAEVKEQLQVQISMAAEAGSRYGARGRQNSRQAQRAVSRLENELAELESAHSSLDPWAPFMKPMMWPVEFPEVFEAGGFDIVVANPPYVRQEALLAADQEAYKETFPDVYAGTADLLVFFYARALHILKDGGHIGFITSNKYMRAGYGEGLRGFLPAVTCLSRVIDFGDLNLFEQAAYPAVVIGRKQAPEEATTLSVCGLAQNVRRSLATAGLAVNVANVREQLENLPELVFKSGIPKFPQVMLRREGWVLEDPALLALFDRFKTIGTPLGEFVQGRMYYGIKTGLNEAFVIDQAVRDELVASDPKSSEIIRPWLRGRDVKRWRPEWADLYLVALQNSGDADASNPWSAASTEREARQVFQETYPSLHDHLSQFEEKLRARADQGRWWWELRACAYYQEFEQPKIIFATVAPEPRFLFDESRFFANQKCYIMGGLDPWAVALLNSQVFFVLAAATSLSERQNGFYEWERKYMWNLPVVTPSKPVRERLGSLEAELRRESSESLNAEVNDLVAGSYGLSEREGELVDEWYKGHNPAGQGDWEEENAE
ncbi:MAG: hypothetical protein C4521_00975 [Actinobacteria bacterium]|nr:MAG: hypothetical protein C4521_00975 [Actinomycetota bacterium]